MIMNRDWQHPYTAYQKHTTAPSAEDTPDYGVTLSHEVQNTTNPKLCNRRSRADNHIYNIPTSPVGNIVYNNIKIH